MSCRTGVPAGGPAWAHACRGRDWPSPSPGRLNERQTQSLPVGDRCRLSGQCPPPRWRPPRLHHPAAWPPSPALQRARLCLSLLTLSCLSSLPESAWLTLWCFRLHSLRNVYAVALPFSRPALSASPQQTGAGCRRRCLQPSPGQGLVPSPTAGTWREVFPWLTSPLLHAIAPAAPPAST